MISVVIPAYNEGEALPEIIRRISAMLYGKPHEIIVVDDGSTDNTQAVLRNLEKKCVELHVVSLEKNCGQTAALQKGFDSARGSIVVSMDADLQNLPEDIPLLLGKLEEGFDVVCGWRHKRQDSLGKRASSYLSNAFIRMLTGYRLHDYGCTLRAYRKKALQKMRLNGEQHRFIPLVAALQGWKVTEIKVRHQKRQHGTTNYSSMRFLIGARDLIYSLITAKRII